MSGRTAPNALALCLIVLLTGCSTTGEPNQTEGPAIYAKSGMTAHSAVTDYQECDEHADNTDYPDIDLPTGGSWAGILAGLALNTAVNLYIYTETHRLAFEECMTSRDYYYVDVPNETIVAFQSAGSDDEKVKVLKDWMSSPHYDSIAAWFAAEKVGTAEAYREYLAGYPDGNFRYFALINAAAIDNKTMDLSVVRQNTTLVGRFKKLNGVQPSGWITVGKDGRGPVRCDVDMRANMVIEIDNGRAAGFLTSEEVPTIRVTGHLDAEGLIVLRADWPANDPLIFEGQFHKAGVLAGKLDSTRGAACKQTAWLEVID